MKILLLTVDYPPIEGGIATVSLQLSRELAALGHEVTVIAPAFPDMAPFDALEPCAIVRFPGYALGWGRFFPLLLKAFPRLGTADLILAMNIAYGGVIGRLATAFFGKPVINFAYAYEFLKFRRSAVLRALLQSIYNNCHTTVAISTYTAHNLIHFGAPAEKVVIVRPGAARSNPVPRDLLEAVRLKYELFEEHLILAVGRFIPRKGHLKLVNAMPAILEREPHTQLVLVGRGPAREDCIQKAAALGIEHLVVCPGYLPDEELAALYELCTVFALPTDEDEAGQVEGFGLVYSEAHARGKPVVAGRAGGVMDAVKHEETGLLVISSDHDALVESILRLIQDPEFARRMGEAGRRRVEEELNWHVFAEALLAQAPRPGGP